MKLEIISFTRAGSRLCLRLAKELGAQGDHCHGYVPSRFLKELEEAEGTESASYVRGLNLSLEEWTRQHFYQADGLIYIGASGIAVRAVAPFLKDKMTDPAVIAADEQGRYVISLLSGHIGGANDLARRAARILGAEPVITTASDRQGRLAIDEWAKKQGLQISDRKAASQVAAAFVNGEAVGFFSDDPDQWQTPEGYAENQRCRCNVWVTCKEDNLTSEGRKEEEVTLRLIPRVLVLGIGCRKKTSAEAILDAVRHVFKEYRLDLGAVSQVATIDLKKEEEGLLQAARILKTGFSAYSAEELKQAEGSFAKSAFVERVAGVENVCERAALRYAGSGGRLLVKKQIYPGVTVAVALLGSRQKETEAERMEGGYGREKK